MTDESLNIHTCSPFCTRPECVARRGAEWEETCAVLARCDPLKGKPFSRRPIADCPQPDQGNAGEDVAPG